MPRWLSRVLKTVHRLAAQEKVRFTHKALREMAALDLALDEADACEVLKDLTDKDSAGRIASARTGEWMYVFKPRVAGTVVYLKLVLRADCVVVSLHEELDDHDEENASE